MEQFAHSSSDTKNVLYFKIPTRGALKGIRFMTINAKQSMSIQIFHECTCTQYGPLIFSHLISEFNMIFVCSKIILCWMFQTGSLDQFIFCKIDATRLIFHIWIRTNMFVCGNTRNILTMSSTLFYSLNRGLNNAYFVILWIWCVWNMMRFFIL